MSQRQRKGVYFREKKEGSMLSITSKPLSGKGVAIVKGINRVKEIVDLHRNTGKAELTTSHPLAKLPSVKGKGLRNFLLLQGESKQKLLLT